MTTGIYKTTNAQGFQNYIIFAVRVIGLLISLSAACDNLSGLTISRIMAQPARASNTTTLARHGCGNTRTVKGSFDRPYGGAVADGGGQFVEDQW